MPRHIERKDVLIRDCRECKAKCLDFIVNYAGEVRFLCDECEVRKELESLGVKEVGLQCPAG